MVDKLNTTPEYEAATFPEVKYFDLLQINTTDLDIRSALLKISYTQSLRQIPGQGIEELGETIKFSFLKESVDYEWSMGITGSPSEPHINSMDFDNPNGPSWRYIDGSTTREIMVNLKHKPGTWDLDLQEIKTLGGKLTVFDETKSKVKGESADAIIELNNRNILTCAYVLQTVVKNPSILTASTHGLVKNPNLI